MSSPGDRDKTTDLRLTPGDFFTRDLDDAVRSGQIDCALHSAKDLPEPLPAGLDLVYLPWFEDPRDVLILPPRQTTVPPSPRIGVSSARREEYCKKRWPDAIIKSIRGNIEQRIEQLDNGDYDLLIMAAAGLNRLQFGLRISEYIPLNELTPPPGQGKLALTFRAGDRRFQLIRSLFAKPVIFAGAGIGSVANVTRGTIEALSRAEICFYDALCPPDILDLLPSAAEKIAVGKRLGEHALPQEEISARLVDSARKLLSVVRLKGGDPGIFGRLAEETELLDQHALPYRVLPGISSLTVATSTTGLLLTRRGLSRGFTVATPRRSGSGAFEPLSPTEQHDLPQVQFMAAAELPAVCANWKQQGYAGDLPAAVVYDAGGEEETIITGTIDNIVGQIKTPSQPGLVIAGNAADRRYLFARHGALRGMKILFTGSTVLQEKAAELIRRYDGRPILRPMIRLQAVPEATAILNQSVIHDWLIITSPAAAELLFSVAEANRFDLRRLPKLAVCGPGTAAPFIRRGIYPEVCPEHDFGAAGLTEELRKRLFSDESAIRPCSDLAAPLSASISDIVFYHNRTIHYDTVPEFDVILFTSSSSVRAFAENFTAEPLRDKVVAAIGKPTAAALDELKTPMEVITGIDAALEPLVYALARRQVNLQLNGDKI